MRCCWSLAAVAGTFLALPSGALAQGGTALCVGPKPALRRRPVRRRSCRYLGNRSAEAAAQRGPRRAVRGVLVGRARTRAGPSRSRPERSTSRPARRRSWPQLTARFPPEAAALLTLDAGGATRRSTAGPSLVAAHEHVIAMAAAQPDFIIGHGIGCHDSDAYPRPGLASLPEATPEIVARVHGAVRRPRRHRARSSTAVPDRAASPGRCPPFRRSTPRGTRPCRRRPAACAARRSACGRRTTRRCARSRSAAGNRSVTAKRGKRARLALKSRATRVTLTVSLRDGRTATQTFTYRRCG